MEQLKAFLKRKNIVISAKRYGIDALGAMAQGLFCSLRVGTIIKTQGQQLGIPFLVEIGGYASAMSGPAMAAAIGYALQAPPLGLFSLGAVGAAAHGRGGAGGAPGGIFSYTERGEPLLIGENLNEAVEPEKIREYIWFMETKTPYTPAAGENLYYLGQHNDTGYYFYYEPQRITVLDYDFLATVTEKAGGTVIYADRCSIDDGKLSQMGIVFKKIPRDISRL